MWKSVVGAALCIAGASADAAFVSVQSQATDLNNGLWRYNYTFTNSADNPNTRGVSVIRILLFSDILSACVGLPNGWSCQTTSVIGFPNEVRWGTDTHDSVNIHPGETLGGFAFTAAFAPISYNNKLALDTGPSPVTENVQFLGPGSPLAIAAFGVPEPSSLALVALGLGGLVVTRRK